MISKRNKEEIGFGGELKGSQRLILPDGSFNLVRKGAKFRDLYTDMIHMSWLRFFLFLFGICGLFNLGFALGFVWLGVDQIEGIEEGGFLKELGACYFFAMQTFTTVGYGAIHPVGVGANVLASITAFTGLLWFALATGLSFARFSQPTITILRSRHALIAPYKEGKALMIRIANGNHGNMRDLQAQMTLSWLDEHNDSYERHFQALNLERDQIKMFPLNWTLVHPITEESPLYSMSEKQCENKQVEVIVYLKGYDDTYATVINRIFSYTAEEVLWNHQFKKMYYEEDGRTVLRLDWIDQSEEV